MVFMARAPITTSQTGFDLDQIPLTLNGQIKSRHGLFESAFNVFNNIPPTFAEFISPFFYRWKASRDFQTSLADDARNEAHYSGTSLYIFPSN
jgi:hypothetical protein